MGWRNRLRLIADFIYSSGGSFVGPKWTQEELDQARARGHEMWLEAEFDDEKVVSK